jgi:hypothetical protein
MFIGVGEEGNNERLRGGSHIDSTQVAIGALWGRLAFDDTKHLIGGVVSLGSLTSTYTERDS